MAAITGKRSATFIDMTPMVDLAFLLLTFFVLTTSFFKPQVLPIAMPEKVTDTIKPPPLDYRRALTLVLGDHDKVYWYMGVAKGEGEITDFSTAGIRKLLLQKQVEIKNLYVLIKPSDKSQYKNMIDVLDEMVIANVQRYAIVDIEQGDKKLIGS